MVITATCATIAMSLLSARGGETIVLRGQCSGVTIERAYPQPVTVVANGSQIAGLRITGGNVRWRGGTIVAPNGAFASGPSGYGVFVSGEKVLLDGVTITAAKKGLVLNGAKEVTVINSRFVRLGEDGVSATNSSIVKITNNLFAETIGRPTKCETAKGISFAVRARDCAAAGGKWQDGFHNDAVQMRDGMSDVTISDNTILGATQGLAQMDTTGDKPLQRVRIERNLVRTDGYHQISLSECIDCVIRDNVVERAQGSKKKAVIRPGRALTCGNKVPDLPSSSGPKC